MIKNKHHDKKKEAQRQQAAAKIKLRPRGLARSVAKYYGHGKIDEDWKVRVACLPRTGRSRIHRKMVKVEEAE